MFNSETISAEEIAYNNEMDRMANENRDDQAMYNEELRKEMGDDTVVYSQFYSHAVERESSEWTLNEYDLVKNGNISYSPEYKDWI